MDVALALGTATLGTAAEKVGVVAVALCVAAAVLARDPRARAAGMLGALALTPVLLVAEIWNTTQLRPIRDRPALAAAAAVVALLALVGAAWIVRRRPSVFPVAAVAVLPFRIPIESGGQTANLLVPLYFVVAAGALAAAIEGVRRRDDPEAPTPRLLERLLVGYVVLYAAQAAYSSDFSKALQQIVFFYVPFTLLFVLLARLRWTPRLVAACFGTLVGLALLFAGVGFAEYATRTVFLNPKAISTNQFEPYFRVSSLFFDPNIYGRFLVMVIVALAALLLWTRRRREAVLAAAALAVLWAALVLTLSQSSFSALLVGLALLAALRWGVARTATVCVAAAAVAAVVVLAVPSAVGLEHGRKSLDRATSGRAGLVRGGVHLFERRPLQGWGSAAFSHEFERQRNTSTERAVSASHTIPITVAVEQGVVGLALYLALLAAALARLLPEARRSPVRAAIAAAFVALVFHTLLYAAFLEDPLAWALLGAGTALAFRRGDSELA